MPYALRYAAPPIAQKAPENPRGHIETVYVSMSVKDPQRHPPKWLRNFPSHIMAVLAIAMLLPMVVSPEVYATRTLAVPAIMLPVRNITATVSVKATGVKTYPAQAANGSLTITNGGSLSQYIQGGFLLTSSGGVEVATDEAVTVPAGNGVSYGVATVGAHAVVAGRNGNIPAYSVDWTYGTDIFIKNLSAFYGGRDAYSVQYVTDQDKQTALASAKMQVETEQPLVLLLKPCTETTNVGDIQVSVTLTCQPITYHVPDGIHVLSVRIQGNSVLLTYKTPVAVGT